MSFPNCYEVTDAKHVTEVGSYKTGCGFVCCARICVIVLLVATVLYEYFCSK
jgi:hypothetical protein